MIAPMRLLYQIPVAYCKLPDRDENSEAVRKVEKATDSEQVKGEELLESEKLKKSWLRPKSTSNLNRQTANFPFQRVVSVTRENKKPPRAEA